MKVYDIVLADSCFSESNYAKLQSGDEDEIQYPGKELNAKLEKAAAELNLPLHVGRIHSGDVFYYEEGQPGYEYYRGEKDCLCVDMESFALFHNAKVLGKNAACILTISIPLSHTRRQPQRSCQNAFTNMMQIALEAAIAE